MIQIADDKIDVNLALTLIILLGIGGFVTGILSGLALKPDQIENDDFEKVMLRETIESYNASITAYEKNQSQTGYELAESGTMHLWALMHTQNDKRYDEVFRVVTIKCMADLNKDKCPSLIPQARDNLQTIYSELKEKESKGVNQTT